MKNYGQLTREEVLEDLDALAEIPEFLYFRNDYTRHAVEALDLELAMAMLGLGADPDRPDGWSEGHLRDLLEGFMSQCTTKNRSGTGNDGIASGERCESGLCRKLQSACG